MISVNEAVKRGITKLRLPNWADPADHIEIAIIKWDGENAIGPWYKLWSPTNEIIGNPNPFVAMNVGGTALNMTDDVWEPYNENQG